MAALAPVVDKPVGCASLKAIPLLAPTTWNITFTRIMKNTLPFLIIIIALVAVFLIVTPFWFNPPTQKPNVTPPVAENTSSTPPVTKGTLPRAPIPQGSQTYQIMQASTVMPKIVQATVDPVNVHVGDTQRLTVIISDPDPINSVVAMIQTDNGTTTVPLTLVGAAALNDVAPQRYFVNAENQLVLTNPIKNSRADNVALAAKGDQKYSATWTVKDTHVARYFTVFTATDAKGNVNSVKIGWTDTVCSWNGINNSNGATSSISSVFGSAGCKFLLGGTDGVENGNLLIDAPVILDRGSTLVLNSGHSIVFSGSGYLLMPTVTPLGQILFSEMYCASSGWVTAFSSPADGTYQVARSQLASTVFPGQTAYFTTPTLTNYGSNTYNYDCAQTTSKQVSTSYTTCSVTNSPTCGQPGKNNCVAAICGEGSPVATPACGSTYSSIISCNQSASDACDPSTYGSSCGVSVGCVGASVTSTVACN